MQNSESSTQTSSLLGVMASLGLAAAILVCLLVAMAAATVFETRHGTEQTHLYFYNAWWFRLLLILLGVNVLSAMIVRYPFSRRQVGFVVTHASILLVLLGAWVTRQFGIDGQLTISEGQSVREFEIPREVLAAVDRAQNKNAVAQIDAAISAAARATDHLGVSPMNVGDITLTAAKFVPDSTVVPQVLNDSPTSQPAVEVELSENGAHDSVWVFSDPGPDMESDIIRFRVVRDRAELVRLLHPAPSTQPASAGTMRIDYRGVTYQISVDESLKNAVPLGETSAKVRTLRYLPHAVVGADKKVVSLSDRPANPAVEVQITAPEGTETRLLFARFPEFASAHAKENAIPGLKIVYLRPDDSPAVPIEIIADADGQLYVRFTSDTVSTIPAKAKLGSPVDTPWSGRKLTVRHYYQHARMDYKVVPAQSPRGASNPAILMQIRSPKSSKEVWLQKNMPRSEAIDGRRIDLLYANKVVPLGFDLTLDHFQVGYYPGGSHPRSYESQVTIADPVTGQTESRTISMNHPVTHNGYSLYQSSYDRREGSASSVLSVSRDPGKPIVFTGYITMMIGVLVVGITRLGRKGRSQ